MSAAAMVSRRTMLAAAVALITAGCAAATGSSSSAELVWATGGVAGADRVRGGPTSSEEHPPVLRLSSIGRRAGNI